MISRTFKDGFPFTVNPRRLYIFPNRFGIFFILVLLAMLAGSVNYHNNLGYMMTFILGGMYVMSFHLTHRNIKGLEITGIDAPPVFEGEDLYFAIGTVNNGSKRINLNFSLIESGANESFSPEPGFSILQIAVKTRKRGIFRLKGIIISSDYPLGLTRAWTYLFPDNANVAIYPKPVPATEFSFNAISSGHDNGEADGHGKGIDDFSELKSYVPGDPVQRIAWKSLSGGHGLMTKYFEGSSAPVSYMIDWNRISAKSREIRLGIMAYLVIDSELKKKKYGISMPGKHIIPDNGNIHRHECLKALAGFEQDWIFGESIK